MSAAHPALPMKQYALLPCPTLGIMGIISLYGTGPSPVHYGRRRADERSEIRYAHEGGGLRLRLTRPTC